MRIIGRTLGDEDSHWFYTTVKSGSISAKRMTAAITNYQF